MKHLPENILFAPLLYVLLNCHQCLNLYLNCEIEKDPTHETAAKENITNCVKLINKVIRNKDFKKDFLNNEQLYYFFLHQKKLTNGTIELKDGGKQISSYWALLSISEIDTRYFLEVMESRCSALQVKYSSEGRLNRLLILRLLIRYLSLRGESVFSSLISLKYEHDKNPLPSVGYFFKQYENIPNTEISAGDLNVLYGYNDLELRARVAKTLDNLDPNEIERQASKPHGPAEISDMELTIQKINGYSFLCMPFKTGREIKGDSVPENVAYQIFKPFGNFGDNCMVVFITAKKCSQNLENHINRMKSHYRFNIGVIQQEQLAALLKLNGTLT